MASRKLVIEVPESVLFAEKTDEVAFARELKLLAAIKLFELGRLSSGRAAFLDLIQRSRARHAREGGLSSAEVRRRLREPSSPRRTR
jgi:hypothetical protein